VRGDAVSCVNDASAPVAGAPTATYNGVAMTVLDTLGGYESTTNSGTGRMCITSFYLDSPAAGTHALAVTVANTGSSSPLAIAGVAGVIYNAATGGSPEPDDEVDGSGTALDATMDALTMAAGSMMTSAAWKVTAETMTLGTGQTEVTHVDCDGYRLMMSSEPYVAGGADAATFTWATGSRYAAAAQELNKP
jgi:hypothetical protein